MEKYGTTYCRNRSVVEKQSSGNRFLRVIGFCTALASPEAEGGHFQADAAGRPTTVGPPGNRGWICATQNVTAGRGRLGVDKQSCSIRTNRPDRCGCERTVGFQEIPRGIRCGRSHSQSHASLAERRTARSPEQWWRSSTRPASLCHEAMGGFARWPSIRDSNGDSIQVAIGALARG